MKYSIAETAAALVLVFTTMLYGNQKTYASVYMSINPEIRIDINRKDMVVGLEGVNEDGKKLIEGYRYKKKDLKVVMDELVDRAIDMEYLYEGGQITLTLDADKEWIVSNGDDLSEHLNQYLTEKITVTIEVTNTNHGKHEIIIPVEVESSVTVEEENPDYGESDHGEASSDYGESDYGEAPSDYGESDYNEAPSDYGESDYNEAPSDYGESYYGKSTL